MSRKELEAEMGIALNGLIKKYKASGFVGRCWGLLKDNWLGGSHVTLAQGNVIISAHINSKDKLVVHEYERIEKKTILGDEVRKIIQRDTGLEIVNP